jgi:COMPASS component SWD3
MIESKTAIPVRGRVTSVRLQPNFLTAGFTDGSIRSYDLTKSVWTDVIEAHDEGINDMVWDHFGEYLFSCSDDGTIKIWDREGRLMHTLLTHVNFVQKLAIDPLNLLLLSGGADNSAVLWDIRGLVDLEVFKNIHREPLTALDFSHDSTVFLTASYDGKVHLWDVVTLNSINTISYNEQVPVVGAHFSHNSKYIYTSCLNNKVYMWDTFDLKAKVLKQFDGHLNERYRTPLIVMKRDETVLLVAGSEDGSVHLWDVDQGKAGWRVELSPGVAVAADVLGDQMAVAGFYPEAGVEESWLYLLKGTW